MKKALFLLWRIPFPKLCQKMPRQLEHTYMAVEEAISKIKLITLWCSQAYLEEL
jgi:hypothetical protein